MQYPADRPRTLTPFPSSRKEEALLKMATSATPQLFLCGVQKKKKKKRKEKKNRN
jgi:hypothetical protein